MIKVNGQATLRIDFEIKINMTEEEWNNLQYHEQDDIINEHIDYQEACRNADVLEIEVDYTEEV